MVAASPGQIEELGLFGKQRSSFRRSNRATIGHADSRGNKYQPMK